MPTVTRTEPRKHVRTYTNVEYSILHRKGILASLPGISNELNALLKVSCKLIVHGQGR